MAVTLLGGYSARQRLSIPFYLMRVAAGFPSPAEDFVEKTLDLNELCIKHPAATYLRSGPDSCKKFHFVR